MKLYTLEQICPGVTPIPGEPLRYLVHSSSQPGAKHLVDLAAYNGFGRCMCSDFATRKNPKLRDGARPGGFLECKHLRKARRFLAIEVAQQIIKQRQWAANQNRRNNGRKPVAVDHESPAF